ncbi:hypothetical protein EON63_22275 [archaeon]|nr:MAG: hypothetical protein EON63_22275 [archaeon]
MLALSAGLSGTDLFLVYVSLFITWWLPQSICVYAFHATTTYSISYTYTYNNTHTHKHRGITIRQRTMPTSIYGYCNTAAYTYQ